MGDSSNRNDCDELRRYINKYPKRRIKSVLPIEQPTRLELVINLKNAKTLGLAVPATLLAQRRRGDRMIERDGP